MTKKKKKKAKKKTTKKKNDGVVIDQAKLNVMPHPTAGPQITEFEDQLDQQLDEKPQAKRGPGRPRKGPLEPAPSFEMDSDLIAQGFKLPFELWAQTQKVPDLKLTDPEAIAFAKPVKQLLDHYLPNFPEIGIAWASLMITGYTIMGTRFALVAEIKRNKKSSSSNSTGGKDTSQGRPRPSNDLKTPGLVKFPDEIETKEI